VGWLAGWLAGWLVVWLKGYCSQFCVLMVEHSLINLCSVKFLLISLFSSQLFDWQARPAVSMDVASPRSNVLLLHLN
jgi:hypothetical protein